MQEREECYKRNQKGHFNRDCPKLKKFGEGVSHLVNVAKRLMIQTTTELME